MYGAVHIFVEGPIYKGFSTSVSFSETLQLQCFGIHGEFTPRADRSLASVQRMHHNLSESSTDK